MIYLAFTIIVFCLFIIYKERGDTKIFLFTLVLGWVITVVCFIVYLQYLEQRELYISLFYKALYGRRLLPKIPVPKSGVMDSLIMFMNFGSLLFIYSVLSFALSFIRPLKKNTALYLLLAIPLLIELVLYCPWVYQFLYRTRFSGSSRSAAEFAQFFTLDEITHRITLAVNFLYLLSGLGFMIYHYLRTPRLKYFRSYFLFIFSGYLTSILLFTLFFWWAPKRLISMTTEPNSMHILPVSILIEGKMLAYYPYVMLLSFFILLVSLYRFNHVYFDLKNLRTIIVRSFDISHSGIRFFNHMVKNYAMAALVDAEALGSKIAGNPELTRYTDRIIGSSHDLLNTLDGIQTKVSISSINPIPTDISALMREALNLVNLDGITLRFDEEDSPHWTLADPYHMKEAFINLLNNAVQAMTGNTRILTVRIRQEKIWVDISITDSGSGIERSDLQKIFIPFYSTKSRKENWGLGLSYCYRIIMTHHGKIYVDSEPSQGTTVKIHLPLIDDVRPR